MVRSITSRRWRLLLILGLTATLVPILAPRSAHAAAGRIREFVVPTSSSHPGGIVVGPDGAVWFTEIATSAIGRLQGRTFTTYALPQGGTPIAIADFTTTNPCMVHWPPLDGMKNENTAPEIAVISGNVVVVDMEAANPAIRSPTFVYWIKPATPAYRW